MGSTISMDVSANLQDGATDGDTAASSTREQITFEDKLRQEVILVPEDLTDIHIEAPYTKMDDPENSDGVEGGRNPHTTDGVEGGRNPHGVEGGRNPHTTDGVEGGRNLQCNPRRNPRRKKQAATTATATTVPFQTERTIEQRRAQIRPIMDKLTELQMNVSYPAIRELYKQLQTFVKTGEDAKIKIPFPEFSRRIKGELTNATYKPCWVKLEMD